MSSIVRRSARLVSPFLVTYGASLMIHGHIGPGGGFQGGVILAVSVILLMTSHGYHTVREKFKTKTVQILESSSLALLILLASAGAIGGSFFLNFLKGGEAGTLLSGGTVPLVNAIIGLEVGAAFTLLFYVVLRRVERD
ncbi:MAG: MnhB domain-containing protein [Thermoplasmatota archaeon]